MNNLRRMECFKGWARVAIISGLFSLVLPSIIHANPIPASLLSGQVSLPLNIQAAMVNHVREGAAVMQSTTIHVNSQLLMRAAQPIEQVETSIISVASEKVNIAITDTTFKEKPSRKRFPQTKVQNLNEGAHIFNANTTSEMLDHSINLVGVDEARTVGVIKGEIILSNKNAIESEDKNGIIYYTNNRSGASIIETDHEIQRIYNDTDPNVGQRKYGKID